MKSQQPLSRKEFLRQRRGRNLALGTILFLLVVLFFAISMVRFGRL